MDGQQVLLKRNLLLVNVFVCLLCVCPNRIIKVPLGFHQPTTSVLVNVKASDSWAGLKSIVFSKKLNLVYFAILHTPNNPTSTTKLNTHRATDVRGHLQM